MIYQSANDQCARCGHERRYHYMRKLRCFYCPIQARSIFRCDCTRFLEIRR